MCRKRRDWIKFIKRGSFPLFFCLFLSSAWAAPVTTLKGKAIDQSNQKPISGASIEISNLTGKVITSTTTDKNGNYTISKSLSSGLYFIECSAKNYQKSTLLRYLQLGKTYTFNFSLKPIPPNNPPKIISIIPRDRSTFITGDILTISINASDPDKDRLQYRYIMDKTILKNWTDSSKHSFKTEISDRGRHKIKVEIRDNRGGFDSKSVDIYIFIAFPKPGS
ncbi:MAG: carboxypeptidase-like regulatory domain-containing protein [Candidatus Omnitrophica bacterium]|nr:carboxypeptidase-like regulatory domain-containing protein [Candidatus Omnitrophota bacterium]